MGPPRGLLIHPLLESAPVPPALQAHDPAEAGRLEVSGRHHDPLVLQPVQQRAPRLARELGIHVGARDPVRLLQLHRAVGGVAQHQRALAARGDEDRHVARRVARRRHRCQRAREARLARHELDEPEVRERPHARRRVGKACGLHVGRVARVPVLRADPVARPRERRHPAAAGVGEVPADVVAMQMRHHDHVDLVRAHAVGREVAQQLAPRHVGRVLGPWAEPRVHEDRAPVGADQVGAEVEADLVRLGQVGAVRLPLVLGDRQELDVADADHVVGHGGPEAYHTLLHYRRTRRSPTGGEVMSKPIALVIAALLGGLAAVPSALAQTTTLTMSSWVSPQHHLTANVLVGWANEVEKATNGRVKFTMLPKHPSAPPGTFDAVRDGLVDLSYVTASYTPARHVLPLVAELPGAGDTAEINSVAYNRLHWKYLDKAGEYKGVHLLGVFTHGPGQMFNTKRPIKSLADLQGMKIRTGGGIAEAMARALGASAFVKPAPESYELLSAGIADGVFFPQESIVSFKLDSLVKYATLFPGGFYSSSFGFFINEDKWNKLAKAEQDLLSKFGGEHLARRAGKSWDNVDRVGNEGMKKAGVQIEQANPALVREIQSKAQPVIQAWIKDAKEKRNIDGATVLKEFHEELKRVAAGK